MRHCYIAVSSRRSKSLQHILSKGLDETLLHCSTLTQIEAAATGVKPEHIDWCLLLQYPHADRSRCNADGRLLNEPNYKLQYPHADRSRCNVMWKDVCLSYFLLQYPHADRSRCNNFLSNHLDETLLDCSILTQIEAAATEGRKCL
jgi:hypothetical protein